MSVSDICDAHNLDCDEPMAERGAVAFCNIGHPFKSHSILKSHDMSFVNSTYFNIPTILRLYTGHSSFKHMLYT